MEESRLEAKHPDSHIAVPLEPSKRGKFSIEAFLAAVATEDWSSLELQWPDLPDELQMSRSGKGIFATMQRGLKRYELAGKAYYELYQESSEPGYLTDALLCFIEAANWSLAKAVLDYLLMQQEYHSGNRQLLHPVRAPAHKQQAWTAE